MFYPGLYVNDTLTQITQIFSGVYTNHHPFYHTQLIRLCLALGDKLFGSINAGVAGYSILSVVFMSACFAYSAYSIHQLTGSKTAAIVTLVWYMVMPTHITYSFTVWKDTPFAGAYKLVVALLFAVVIALFLLLFLGTRLGLSIRATGDNIAMVKSSSINPVLTTTVGLCIGGAMTGLAGCLLGEYQKSVDINMGTGMVTVALASLIIGETLVGKKSVGVRIIGVIFGSCLYRVIVAIALRFNLPASALKLVSAVIVAVAISMPAIKEIILLRKTKLAAMRKHKEMAVWDQEQRGGSASC